MRKLLVSLVAVFALLAVGSANTAKAQEVASGSTMSVIGGTPVSVALGGGMLAGTTLGMAYLVYRDIAGGGLTRKYAEAVPGAGFQSRDYAAAAKLTHEFNVAMGYADDAQTTAFLASASR